MDKSKLKKLLKQLRERFDDFNTTFQPEDVEFMVADIQSGATEEQLQETRNLRGKLAVYKSCCVRRNKKENTTRQDILDTLDSLLVQMS